MNREMFSTSVCRCCKFYSHEGRRGGTCQQLGVEVQSEWKACPFAQPPFASNWKPLQKILDLNPTFNLNSVSESSNNTQRKFISQTS